MKKILDEMQERKLLKIHEKGFCETFFALILVILVQYIMGGSFRDMVGEMVVLFILGINLIIRCLKSGIWMQEYKPSNKMNFLISIVISVIVAVALQIRTEKYNSILFYENILRTALLMLIISIICFLMLTFLGWIYFKVYDYNENKGE